MEGENFLPPKHYDEIENRSELPLAAVHLAWLSVGDQQSHNQYLQRMEVRQPDSTTKQTKRFRLIDMGQMFGKFNWSAKDLQGDPPAYKLPQHLAEKLTPEKLEQAIQELKKVEDSAVQACLHDCPDEWGIPQDDKEAGAVRILKAREQIQNILEKGNPSIYKKK